MPTNRRAQRNLQILRDVEPLPDIIETVEFDHEMMNVVSSGLNQGKAVVARVDMEEKSFERFDQPITEPKAQEITIERQECLDVCNGEHRMAEAERTRAETRDGATWLEGLDRGLRAMEGLEPGSKGILEHDELLDASFGRERASATSDLDLGGLQPGGQPLEGSRIGQLPAKERRSFANVWGDDEPLSAVIHPQAKAIGAALINLHAKEARRKRRPIVELVRPDADVAQRFDLHGSFSDARPKTTARHSRLARAAWTGRMAERPVRPSIGIMPQARRQGKGRDLRQARKIRETRGPVPVTSVIILQTAVEPSCSIGSHGQMLPAFCCHRATVYVSAGR